MQQQGTHAPPPLRLPPPPRRVWRRRGPNPLTKPLGYLLVALPVGLLLLWYVVVAIAVTTAGVERPATVVDKDVVRTRRGTIYWVTYDYTDPRGAVRGRSPASFDVWYHYHRGSSVKVRAVRILGLPRSEIIGSGAPLVDPSFYVLAVLAVGFNLLTCIVVAATLQPARRRRAIVKDGVPTTGRVVGKSLRKTSKGYTTRTVTYEYTGDEIRPVRGTMLVTADEYARVHEGDAVPIVFLPGVKDRSLIYGFGEYAALDDAGNELP